MKERHAAVADEAQRVTDALAFWQAYDPSVRVDLSCCAVRGEDGWVFVDPIPLVREALNELLELAPPACIFLTNGNHARAAEEYRETFSIPVLAHEDAAPELGISVDRFVREGDVIAGGMRVIELAGAGPGEVALLSHVGLHVGDALIHLAAEGFTLLPDKYCSDPKKLRQNLRKLLNVEFTLMTFAHGLPLLKNPRETLAQLFA